MRLLLIEDDRMISDGLKTALQQSGYAVDIAENAQTGELSLATQKYALILLDPRFAEWLRAGRFKKASCAPRSGTGTHFNRARYA